jgi:hypothetical protein
MQLTDSNGNVFGTNGLEIIGPDGKPKGGGSGAQGPAGPQGVQGITGIQGSVGSQGFTGTQGTTGTGTQGTTGSIGPQGVQGIIGIQGTTGTIGSQGIVGSQGIQGLIGTGTQGTQGITGTGTQGTTGAQGLRGAQGVQGPSGGGGGGTTAIGIHALVKPRSGVVISAMLTTTGYSSGSQVANRMILYPFIPANNFVSTEFIIRVATAQAGSSAMIVMYNDLNGSPNFLLFASVVLDCSTTGNKTFALEYPFFAGETYWIGYWGNGTQSVFTMPAANMLHIRSAGAIPAPSNGVIVTTTFNPSPPAQLTVVNASNQAMPFVGITQQ